MIAWNTIVFLVVFRREILRTRATPSCQHSEDSYTTMEDQGLVKTPDCRWRAYTHYLDLAHTLSLSLSRSHSFFLSSLPISFFLCPRSLPLSFSYSLSPSFSHYFSIALFPSLTRTLESHSSGRINPLSSSVVEEDVTESLCTRELSIFSGVCRCLCLCVGMLGVKYVYQSGGWCFSRFRDAREESKFILVLHHIAFHLSCSFRSVQNADTGNETRKRAIRLLRCTLLSSM